MEEDYVTADEVAERLRISGETVRAWCRTKKLKATKAGKQWRIKPRDVESFLNAQPETEVQQEPKKAEGLAAFAY